MFRRSRRGVPWGLLGMIALLVLAESVTGRADLGASNPDGVFWRYRSRASRREAPHCRVLCLGDSLVKYAVDPAIVGARLRRRVCNLALPGGPPAASFFQLRRALAAGARPDALVVDFIPHLLDWDVRYCSQLLPEVADVRDCLDLARSTRDPGLVTTIALARVFPTLRDRHGLRARLSAVLSRSTESVAWRNWEADHGGDRNPRLRPGDGLFDNILYPDGWACAPANGAYVERFLDLAEQGGVPVFWVIPPFRPDAHARRERRGLEAAYTRYVRGVQARHKGLVVVDGRHSSYDESAHSDPLHLNRRGARVFSSDLSEIVGRYLSSGMPGDAARRWVQLPAYRAQSKETADRLASGVDTRFPSAGKSLPDAHSG